MHKHQLHSPVRVECLCCKLEQKFIFKSNSDPVVCGGCVRHQGDTLQKAKLRDSDHVKMWSAGFSIAQQDHSDQIALLEARIEKANEILRDERKTVEDLRYTLKNELTMRPESVQKWIDDERVTEANAKRDAAYRSRDFAMANIWMVNKIHRSDLKNDGRCTCGKSTRSCREWQALSAIEGHLYKWERKQEDRRQQGLPHALPDGSGDFLYDLRRAL